MKIEAPVEIFAGYNLQPIKKTVIERLALKVFTQNPHLSTAEAIATSKSRGEPITDIMLNKFLSDIGKLEIILPPGQSPEETLLVLVIRTTFPQDTGMMVLSYKPPPLPEDRKACDMAKYHSINQESTEVYTPQEEPFIAVSRTTPDSWIYSIPYHEN